MGTSITGGGFISSSSQVAEGVILNTDIADASIELSKLKPTGTADYILTSNGLGAAPEYKILSGAASKLTLISTQNFASNTLTWSSLSGQKVYLLIINCNITGVANLNCYFNGDTTDSNYSSGYIRAVSKSISAEDNASSVFYVTNGGIGHAVATIWRNQTTGKINANVNATQKPGDVYVGNYETTTTPAEITSITLLSGTITGSASLYYVGDQ